MTHVEGRASDHLVDADRPVTRSHRLGELDAIAEVLDRHPRHQLQAFTMGADPTRDEW
jgi:hypothetical protein